MSVDYSQLLKCNYGTTALALESYAVTETAVISDFGGRQATAVNIVFDGYIQATDQNDLAAKILAIEVDLTTDGRDLLIYGLGGLPEFGLLAAQSLNGGPHVDFEMGDGPTALMKTVRISAHTQKVSDKTNANHYKVSVKVRPDLLRTVTWTGEVNYADNADYFLTGVVPQFKAAYAPPIWVSSYEYETAMEGLANKLSYSITARENYGPLPDFGGVIGNAIDGQASKQIEIDEQRRKTTVYDFEFNVFAGDPFTFVAQLRKGLTLEGASPNNPSPRYMLREAIQFETIRENRLHANFTILESAGTNPLMNFTQSMQIIGNGPVWEEKNYFGADPILVQAPTRYGRVVISGNATGAGQFMRATGNKVFTFRPSPHEVTYTEMNGVEKQTAWNDQFFFAKDNGSLWTADFPPNFLARQDQEPQFYPPDKTKP